MKMNYCMKDQLSKFIPRNHENRERIMPLIAEIGDYYEIIGQCYAMLDYRFGFRLDNYDN